MQKNYFYRFLVVWFGQFISSIGSGLTAFTLGIYVFQLTHSATSYSLVLLAAFLPSLLLKPIGGTLADRMNRRVLMVIGDVGSALGVIFIVFMMHQSINHLWVIYTGMIVSSIFVAFQNPAYKASVTDLVDKSFYTKSSGLMQLAESSKYLISPILAGFLIKITDIKTVLIIDAMTFLFAIVSVFWIGIKNKSLHSIPENHFFKDFIEGFSYLFKNKSVFILILIISFVTFFIGLFQALLGPMILSFTNAQALGFIMTVSTTGMLVGSCFLGIFGKTSKKIPMVVMSLMLNGLFFSLFGIATNMYVMTFFGFLFFLVLPFLNTSLDVLIRQNVDNAIQGRLWAIVSLVSQLGMIIAFGTAGYLADNIFNPLLEPSGTLAKTIGLFIGVGDGRGIGLMFVISGLLVFITAIIIGQLKILKKLDSAVKE